MMAFIEVGHFYPRPNLCRWPKTLFNGALRVGPNWHSGDPELSYCVFEVLSLNTIFANQLPEYPPVFARSPRSFADVALVSS